jgi:hypothetical protein
MKRASLARLWLRLRIALSCWHPAAVGAALLLVAAVVALAWLRQADDLLRQQQDRLRRMAALPAERAVAPPGVDQNLAAFRASLGDSRYAEEQVKVLFGLAAKSGLVLRQGEYKLSYDRNAKLGLYQISLPVSGSYRAIWQFTLLALRAIPFASLDDISFRRDAIGAASVDARLRLTLYLSDAGQGGAR